MTGMCMRDRFMHEPSRGGAGRETVPIRIGSGSVKWKSMEKALLLCLLCLTGCGCQREPQPQVECTLRPLEECREISDLQPCVAEADVIRIREGAGFLADISKVLLDREGTFYVLDVRGNLCLLHADGTRSEKTINRGRASDEYLRIEDMALTDTELLLLDGGKVKCFDRKSLKRIRTLDIRSGIPFDALAPRTDGGAYLFSAFPDDPRDPEADRDCLLYRVDAEGRVAAEGVRREECVFSVCNVSQSFDNRYFLRPQNSRHVFYRLTAEGIVPEYRMDFREANIPARYYYDAADEDIRSFMVSDFYKLPMNLHETASHLCFDAVGPKAVETCFVYDRRSKRGIRWTSRPGDLPMRVVASDDAYFYLVLPDFAPVAENPGPLTAFVSALLPDASNPDSMYIVRLKFSEFE